MKIAVVCDWLVTYAGAERVIEQILHCFPDSDLYSVIDYLPEDIRKKHFLGKRAVTTFIQKLPFAKRNYQKYLPLMPLAIEQLDLSAYELIISSSHAVAKGIITGPNQAHICYIHSPMRYVWDHQNQYLKGAKLTKGLRSLLVKHQLHRLRKWDFISSARPDLYIANSKFIARRVEKTYRRQAIVIYPPVDTEKFCQKQEEKANYYLTTSRLVSYKRVDLLVQAFSKMQDKKLVIIGDGPEMHKLRKMAEKNITFLGFQSEKVLVDYMQKAKAFVYAAEEDFGISVVEAQACGTPIIAYGSGGCAETVVDVINGRNPTGVLFDNQTTDSIISAVKYFENNNTILSNNCVSNASEFSIRRFREDFLKAINQFMDNR